MIDDPIGSDYPPMRWLRWYTDDLRRDDWELRKQNILFLNKNMVTKPCDWGRGVPTGMKDTVNAPTWLLLMHITRHSRYGYQTGRNASQGHTLGIHDMERAKFTFYIPSRRLIAISLFCSTSKPHSLTPRRSQLNNLSTASVQIISSHVVFDTHAAPWIPTKSYD